MRAEATQVDRLRTLIEVSRSLTAELDLNDIIQGILGAAIRVIPGADAGILFLYKEDVKKLVVSHAVGMAPPAYDIAIDPGEGLSGRAFLAGKPTIYSHPEEAETVMSTAREANLRRFEEATGGIRFPQSALAAGLVYKGQPIGAFVVENLHVPGAFDSFDRDLVDALAQAASIAIVNARLFESERQSRFKLEGLNEEIKVQRDQLQRRISVQDALSEVVKEGLPISVLATRLAGLTEGAVVIMDALNRIRAMEPMLEAETAREMDWLDPETFNAALDRAGSSRLRQRLSAKRGAEIVLSPVIGGGEVLGFVGVKSTRRGLDAVDEFAADSAALVAATEFLKERGIEESQIRTREDQLQALLEGRPPAGGPPFAALRPPLGLAAGVLRGEKHGHRPPLRISRAFLAVTQEVVERSGAPVLVTVRDDHVVVVWPLSARSEAEMEADLNTVVAKVQNVAPEWPAMFGVGSRTEELTDLADTYNEVRLGLDVREHLGRYSRVFRVGALGVYRFILRAAAGGHVGDFCDRALGAVIEHDAQRNSQFLSTFRTYLEAGGSVKAAAQTLDVHPHTVQYRLNRLQQISNLRLNQPEDRLTLEMALRVMDALKLVNEPSDQ
jgi:GAF domain-containing protein